jgi:cbb3-type cytochrome oxidase maturation protein
MFYLGWLALTAIGISASIVVFFWALRTGQFSDQGRARYLPLSDELFTPAVVKPSHVSLEVYVLLFIIGIVLTGIAMTLILPLVL